MEYFQLTENNGLPGIGQFAPFRAVLANEDGVSLSRQLEISAWLVDSGCRYAMICGSECQSWEDSIRQANLGRVHLDEMRPEEFVMILQHQRERLRQVFWHAKKHARHTHVKIQNTLVIHVGGQNRSVEYHAMYDKA
jgi:hypothetical protein